MYQPFITTPQRTLFSRLEEQLDRKHPLYILADKVHWDAFETAFSRHYHAKKGRPCKSIRLMVGLLILKHLRDLSDESVVLQWTENAYYQYFCGMEAFSIVPPCEASELVHFRNRIGEEGIELILKESIAINKDDHDGNDDDRSGGTSFIDSTVQEKNVTFPTDAKLAKKIIAKCRKIANEMSLPVRQSYTRTLKALYRDQRFRNHPRNRKKALRADRKLKTIAGRLVRELERNLRTKGMFEKFRKTIGLFKSVLSQGRDSKKKYYSLHEPEVECIGKGKEHKKYEFGNKVSIVRTAGGLIIGAKSFRNEYDGHTIDASLDQVERLTGKRPDILAGDRGYRGQKASGTTRILIPDVPGKSAGYHQRRKLHNLFCKRAGIEPTIGHLKSDHRLGRNFYKGVFGDAVNVMLAAVAYNFKRAMRVLFALLVFLQKVRSVFRNLKQNAFAERSAYAMNFV
jgi:IS5 family transposase